MAEVQLEGGLFTWEKCRGTKDWVEEKLDRAFATTDWWNKFPLCKLSVLMTPVSDHKPVYLELLNVAVSRRAFRFRFENIWLKEPNFVKEVTEFWESIQVPHLISKLE